MILALEITLFLIMLLATHQATDEALFISRGIRVLKQSQAIANQKKKYFSHCTTKEVFDEIVMTCNGLIINIVTHEPT